MSVAFLTDPDEGAAASPQMAASWGAFQIRVHDVNLCAHADEGETLQYCHWYLLPLLEWLTENWDPLLHEERHPSAVRPANTAAEVGSIALDDPELRAVSFASAHHAPRIVLNQYHWSAHRPQTRRFTLAHELCHLLHDRSVGASLAVASGPWAPLAIEQRANAVAAQTTAYRLQLPVLMTASDELPDATDEYITANDVEYVQIVADARTVWCI